MNLQDSRLRQGVGPGTGRPVHGFLYKPFGNVGVCMGLFLYWPKERWRDSRPFPRKKARRAAKSGTPNGLKAAYHIARRTVLNPRNRVRSACFMQLGARYSSCWCHTHSKGGSIVRLKWHFLELVIGSARICCKEWWVYGRNGSAFGAPKFRKILFM